MRSFKQALLLGHPRLQEPVRPGAVPMASGWPFSGRLPEKLLIPLISVTNLSSARWNFLAVDQNELHLKTTFSWRLVRCGLLGLPRNQEMRCFVSFLFCHSTMTLKCVPRGEIELSCVYHAFGPGQCGWVSG